MNDNFKGLPNNLPKITPEMLENIKNIQFPNINIPVQQPNVTKPNFEADQDCPYTSICENLNITERKICYVGADTRNQCSFGESRIILLLSKILSNHDIQE